jgi:hypothetical protein
MNRLPPILARDYFWNVVWPHIQLFGLALVIGAIVIGMMP